MPFALAIIGLLLIVSGARGTYGELKDLLVSDFSGEGNFWNWIIALGVAGSIGYVPSLEKFSRVFIALLLIVLLLSKRGFFDKFSAAFQGGSKSE